MLAAITPSAIKGVGERDTGELGRIITGVGRGRVFGANSKTGGESQRGGGGGEGRGRGKRKEGKINVEEDGEQK